MVEYMLYQIVKLSSISIWMSPRWRESHTRFQVFSDFNSYLSYLELVALLQIQDNQIRWVVKTQLTK